MERDLRRGRGRAQAAEQVGDRGSSPRPSLRPTLLQPHLNPWDLSRAQVLGRGITQGTGGEALAEVSAAPTPPPPPLPPQISGGFSFWRWAADCELLRAAGRSVALL